MSRNAKQVELAKQTLKVFADEGENFSDVRHVVHYFYNGNFNALGASLAELGYTVRLTVGEDGVIAERHEAIGDEWRTSTLAHLCELADSYGVEYDGWEAAMSRQNKTPQSNEAQAEKRSWFSTLFGKKQ